MTVRINKDAINLREKLSELDKPSGLVGEELLRADTSADAREALNLEEHLFEDFESTGIDDNATSTKVTVNNSGVDVTGTLTADGLTVGAADKVQFGSSISGLYRTNSGNDLTLQHWGGVTVLIDSDNNDLDTRSFVVGANSQDSGTAKKIAQFKEGGDVAFYEDTGTTAKFFWDASAESLGIGTSSPDGDLDVRGAGLADLVVRATSTNSTSRVLMQNDAQSFALRINGDDKFRIKDETSDADRLVIDTSGNVGIGTSSPSGTLTVDGSTKPYANSGLVIKRTGVLAGSADFRLSGVSGAEAISVNVNNTERMRIDSSGNVGIGTASPSSALHVRGSGNPTLTIDGSYSAYTSFLTLKAGGAGSSVIRAEGGNNALLFQTNGAERARIDSSGNLLVGKSSSNFSASGIELKPDHLQVTRNSTVTYFNRTGTDGNISVFYKDGSPVGSIGTRYDDIYIGNSGTGITMDATSSRVKPCSPASSGVLRDAAIDLGDPSARFKDLYLSGGVITSSDYRLKDDIQPMQSYADTVKQMNLVNFAWKDSGEREDGFIAHELQALVPSAVRGEKDAVGEDGNEQYQGVDPLKLIPVLTKALQEALERIETLENK